MSTMNILHAKEVLNYKRFDSDTSLSELEIPEPMQNRQKTDKYFLFVFIGFIVLLMPFLIYSLYYSDIRRIKGYDKCGNVCGEKNTRYSEWSCTGQDMTDKPRFNDGTCEALSLNNYWDNIAKDDQEITTFNEENHDADQYVKNVFMHMEKHAWKIVLSSFLSIGYCITMVVLFRHATALLVWGILILSWTCLLLFAVFLWFVAVQGHGMVLAIFFSIIVLGLLCIICFMQKRIRLVIMLIKESAKAVFDMTSILSIPVITIFGLLIIATACTVLTSYISTSGILTEVSYENLEYVPNPWMLTTLIFNIIMAYWAIEFLSGIQYMVISGAITKWYFTRNKAMLGSPILSSAFIVFKFHLGTIALGSLIITLVAILRALMRSLARNPRLRLLIDCCMSYLEGFLKFFTRNSYIITAMHGTPFFKSGKQAVRLIALNICNTIAVNYIGDFVLTMAQVLIICLSTLTTFMLLLGQDDSQYSLLTYLVVAAIALICSYTILGTFQAVPEMLPLRKCIGIKELCCPCEFEITTSSRYSCVFLVAYFLVNLELVFQCKNAVDTMFLCFCEDCLLNDGINKPYAMPRGFMEFVDNMKQVFAKKIQEKGLPTI